MPIVPAYCLFAYQSNHVITMNGDRYIRSRDKMILLEVVNDYAAVMLPRRDANVARGV